MALSKSKQAKYGFRRPEAKEARPGADPESIYGLNPSWQLQRVDYEGFLGWQRIAQDEFEKLVKVELKALEGMTWREIDKRPHCHSIKKSRLSADARQRLVDINCDDIDEVYSLQLGNRPRIVGVRIGAVLRILWWDPHHQACPSEKKNT